MASSYKIFTLRGIDVSLHISFIIILPLFVLLFAGGLASDGSPAAIAGALGYSFAFFIALFGSVLMHELVHSFVAIKNGIRVKQITLTPIGGIANISLGKDAWKELKVSVAGPLSNFALVLVLTAIGVGIFGIGLENFPPFIFGNEAMESILLTPSLSGLFLSIVYINFVLGVFNMFVPIFPMDGGRVLRALIAMVTDYRSATRIAVSISQIFLVVLVGFAILIGNLWLIIIGIFLFLAGIAELQASELGSVMDKVDLKRYTHTNIIIVHPDIAIKEFLDVAVPWQTIYPVVDSKGKARGYIDLHALKPEDTIKKAEQIMKKDFVSIRPGKKHGDALQKIYSTGFAFVLDERGRFYGALTLKNLEEVMQLQGLKRS